MSTFRWFGRLRQFPAVLGLVVVLASGGAAAEADALESATSAQQVAERIDGFLEQHWRSAGIEPAKEADDATLPRRLYLDLVGRIPTAAELDTFLSEDASDKRARLIRRLLEHPEFTFHFGSVLDELIQGNQAGHEPFVDYLRRSLAQRKPWDAIFREIMVGPWDSDELRPANRFLDRRARNLDVLTVDATRVFFGVDISCAQCHDHPLVTDWTQDHYYGMASFFHRTTGGRGEIGEKREGDVKFLSGGEEKTARVMFLSGRVADPQPDGSSQGSQSGPVRSRREQLVQVGLEDRTFFSRAIVNRMWEYFFGRGLVDPVDQMHTENEPSVPGLLSWLADDFADNGYDLHRLVDSIVSTRAYQRGSRWEGDGSIPSPSHFAVMHLRPLTRQQMAASLLLATGSVELTPPSESQRRAESLLGSTGLTVLAQRIELEQAAKSLAAHLDPRTAEFQSSAGEALFLSNAEQVQERFAARDGNLPARLAEISDARQIVETAIRAVLSRPAAEEELSDLVTWIDEQPDRMRACEQLVWALVGSAEFRFNH